MAYLVIVDDDVDMAELLSDFLRSQGHEVRVATDGAEGLGLVRGRAPDVLLLDVEMPLVNGPAMAERMLVHDAGLEKIPVILTSGVLNLADVAADVGTPYLLAKPYALDTLNQLIDRALSERRAPRPTTSRRAS
jgi:DNA-binding NtrC family response regulator